MTRPVRACTAAVLAAAMELAGAASTAGDGGVRAEAGGEVALLTNSRLLVKFSRQTGGVVSLVDAATGQEFVRPKGRPMLFQLVMSRPGEKGGRADKSRVYLSNLDARSVRVHQQAGEKAASLRFEFHDLDGRGVSVTCVASVVPGEPEVRLRLEARLAGGLVLDNVQFPMLSLAVPLGPDGDDDAVVLGRTKGGLYRRPGHWKPGTWLAGRQPGSLAAQFACYYDRAGGLYTACHDAIGYPKGIVFHRSKEGLDAYWEQYCYRTGTFSLGYDIVLTTFRRAAGERECDWRDAADIYKRWAREQPWCRRTYARRPDVPRWLKSGPAMVRFSREWLADRRSVDRWVREYWRKYFPHSARLIVAYWGWEKVATWVTPDYFPVYPSDEEFTALVKQTRRLGCHTFVWPSGYHYTLTYGRREDGSFEWDDRERFRRVYEPHAVHTRDGSAYHGKRSWLRGGETACMCPGDPWTIEWLNGIAVELCKRGAELVQIDQVVGGAFQWCYSRSHEHPPGPGPWMTEAFRRQLRTMLEACRRVEPEAVVCFEEPNEHFIQEVAIQDYRDTEVIGRGYPLAEPASVFNYLYHEYLPTFQSNPRAGDMFRYAHCLVDGQIPHMVPSRCIGPGPLLVNGGFEEWDAEVPRGWQKVAGWKGKSYDGRCGREERDVQSGRFCLWLENERKGQVVQVSQNAMVGETLRVGGKYRLVAWMRSSGLARANAIALATLGAGPGIVVTGRWSLPMPRGAAGWVRREVEFVVPAGSRLLRIMLHLHGPGRVWIDKLRLEEMGADGTWREVMRPSGPPEHKLMVQWVKLYHGAGRPYLLHGTMLHPPPLEVKWVAYAGMQVPAIVHNAFRAPEGREAVVVVNWTRQPQEGVLRWRGRNMRVRLTGLEVKLIALGGG